MNNLPTHKGFEELTYLALNSDVAAAVESGLFESAWDHFLKHGRRENRLGVSSELLASIELLTAIESNLCNLPIPPEDLWEIGGGDFHKIGFNFLKLFVHLGSLSPNAIVLDIGSGVGRMAIPLTQYISSQGRYEGLEIYEPAVTWCKEAISSKYPNFEFQHADIYNGHYNPSGNYDPATFKFPYRDSTFDFVFLTSVFTHLMKESADNYLSEISRVLKPEGTCFSTFFLLNSESQKLIADGKSSCSFIDKGDGSMIVSTSDPESAVAYDEEVIRQAHKINNLAIESIYYGAWPGRDFFADYQDIIVSTKEKA
ncbi:MAG: class I SAM-dependent methyltransferase [Cyanobacteria bacterium Co-bin8]|nr:class I SAM-dependent methyltransferase [Cyanobacteria bacterium Co-bin8]